MEPNINQNASLSLHWKEIYSLAALSSAVAFSWIAYHEYQPHLLEQFNLQELSLFLIVTKAVVLVVIPPIAGWLSDYILRKTGKFLMVFSVGIGITAMAFMAVASIIDAGALGQFKGILPIMLVIWLISMNMFISPALSMIESFAPSNKLPIAVAFLFFTTQLIYALEPVFIKLVLFLGDTLTFVGGGILIGVLGYVFQRVSSDELGERHKAALEKSKLPLTARITLSIIAVGFVLGSGSAFLAEYIPHKSNALLFASSGYGAFYSFGLLGLAAIIALAAGGYVAKQGYTKFLSISIKLLAASIVLILLPDLPVFFTGGTILLAVSFGLLSTSALPFAINNLSPRNLALGVGIFIGASYVVEGLLEYLIATGHLF